MPQQGPIRWLDGEGWLVLLGGGDRAHGETDPVDVKLLSVANLDRPMVVFSAGGGRRAAEAILEHYTRLGGPSGEAFAMENMTRDQLETPALLDVIQEAGIVYLDGENPLPLVNNLHNTQAFRHIVEGFSTLQGLMLVGAGAGAAALGRWVFSPRSPHRQAMGLGFLMNVVIAPHFTRTEDSPVLRALPQIGENLIGLGIPDGTALALGPLGQLEMWGEGQVTAVVHAGETT
jgi:cyanophycinase-like exopeptidase